MTTVRDIAEPLADICVPVPFEGDGICVRCHNHPVAGFERCYSCWRVESQVTRPCGLIVPVSLYEIPSQLHHLLRHYKSGRYPRRQHEFSLKVASLLCHFLDQHRGCIASETGRDWNVITSVPSSSGRVGEHPLVSALRSVPSFFAEYEELLQRGSATADHNRANDNAYRPSRRLDGERVLLVDDTLTSGARAQSAASVLNGAGAEVVAIVPIGRVVDPSWEHVTEWWNTRKRRPFTFAACCLEPF